MQCKKIQELLKADYLDGELNAEESHLIAEHLVKCPHCQKLEKELFAQRALFQKAGQMQVPEHIWQNIRNKIVSERLSEESNTAKGFLERLRGVIRQPRVAFSLTGALLIIIFVSVLSVNFIYRRQLSGKISSPEIMPGYNLNGESVSYLSDLGTNIEEYFL